MNSIQYFTANFQKFVNSPKVSKWKSCSDIVMVLCCWNNTTTLTTEKIVLRTIYRTDFTISAHTYHCKSGTDIKSDSVLFGESPRWLKILFGTLVEIIVSIFYHKKANDSLAGSDRIVSIVLCANRNCVDTLVMATFAAHIRVTPSSRLVKSSTAWRISHINDSSHNTVLQTCLHFVSSGIIF